MVPARPSMPGAYEELLAIVKDVLSWGSIGSILSWDFETYMPGGGTTQRSMQLALLEQLVHEKSTSPRIGELLAVAERDETLLADPLKARNVALVRRDYDKETKLPADLVHAIAAHYPIAVASWKKAKASKDFAAFRPVLEKTVDLIRRKAACLDAGKHPYDVLLDLYEPGTSRAVISGLFEPLKRALVSLVKKHAPLPDAELEILHRPVPVDVQRRLASKLMEFARYDTNKGRLDETEHPFTTGMYDDVRICTHYHERNVTSSVYSVLHEAGHGLYEQHLPVAWRWQLAGTACSMGVHESQSRIVENVIGKSREFWTWFLPVLQAETGSTFEGVEVDAMYRAVNDVRPSKIRIEADEVTYSLHVVLRFELENDLISGAIDVADLPGAWNEKMAAYFGIDIENDAEGVLQDTHWAMGAFGYFPDYALGNIYDGMLLDRLDREVQWRDAVAAGSFQPVLDWLVANVHARGNSMDPLDLIATVAGQAIDAGPFTRYLDRKFAGL